MTIDTTIIGAVLGAITSFMGIGIGWFISSVDKNKAAESSKKSLQVALMLEATSAGWHILNTTELLRRAAENEFVPHYPGVERYMPADLSVYADNRQNLAKLPSETVAAILEFTTHYEQTCRRTRRVCGIDARKTKKAQRLESLKGLAQDWGYVSWACGQCINALLETTQDSITSEQLDYIHFIIRHLDGARSGKEPWDLPDDVIEIRLATDADKVADPG